MLENDDDIRADEVRATATLIRGSVSACDRLIDAPAPVDELPDRADLRARQRRHRARRPTRSRSPSAVLGGVAVALVVGKFVGVTPFSWIAVRLGFGRLPDGVRWGHVIGVGAVAGIGFTVSLFITGLAFDDTAIQDDAKIGILAASIIAALAGAAILAAVARWEVKDSPKTIAWSPSKDERQPGLCRCGGSSEASHLEGAAVLLISAIGWDRCRRR